MFYASKVIDSFLPAGAGKAPTFPGEVLSTGEAFNHREDTGANLGLKKK
jgi:hypothetical protein